MLYTLHMLIRSEKMTKTTAENRKLMIGFCLQALEMSGHRLFVPVNSITYTEKEWLGKLETHISDFLESSVDSAQDAVVMYIDAISAAGIRFYNGAFPLLLIEMLCHLCTRNDRLKTSRGQQLMHICSEILLSLTSCLNKATEFSREGLRLALDDSTWWWVMFT